MANPQPQKKKKKLIKNTMIIGQTVKYGKEKNIYYRAGGLFPPSLFLFKLYFFVLMFLHIYFTSICGVHMSVTTPIITPPNKTVLSTLVFINKRYKDERLVALQM